MATLVLSAIGAGLGAGVGGTVLGLSGAVVGRAVGATLGRLIDQRLLGVGSGAVDHGRIDRLRVTGAGEGLALPRVWGRMRVAGHVIWASHFLAQPGASRRTKGGLGPRVSEPVRYTVSVAIALCEGEISGLGRIWAMGEEIDRASLNLRLYRGDAAQLPDPRIEAIEGPGNAPAYRGTAYVVLEDLDLGPWGNRLPNLSFEVLRPAVAEGQITLQQALRAVAWMPGSGEYALATTPVLVGSGPTGPFGGLFAPPARQANVNTTGGETDFLAALQGLGDELPQVGSALLISSWFGDDLRCGHCTIRPKVEYADQEGQNQPWRSGGIDRSEAPELARLAGQPVYGGTPSDASVLQSIAALQEAGQKVVIYPFMLMEQLAGNDLPDPWSDADEQPPLPWRGRITLSVAPGRPGSPDGTAGANTEVAAFFGTAQPGDFTVENGLIHYSGPEEWSYRRFILHHAALALAAGGVDAFCVGSEMVALTQIRGPGNSFPAVAAMRTLLHDVRAMLGPGVKLTYAADWSEYFGYQPGDGSRFFHLDPIWSDPACDFIGIDNYMPLSDWREGEAHADALEGWSGVHDLAYLKANVAGGEGYDWFYASDHDRAVQARTPITDGAESEPWVWRYKDLRNWWENLHYERVAGVRDSQPTDWTPRSKPIWFTELGCAAIDKGTNQPNKFLDPKSSESALPYFSNGFRDDAMQMQYLRAMAGYWLDPANNPPSDLYDGRMVDWDRAHVWAWDARPFPWFPGNAALWGDAANWGRGHWITGRAMNQPLAAVVAEICTRAGVVHFDVSALVGVVRGFATNSTSTGREALQPLMLAYGLEAVEREGRLIFRHRDGRLAGRLEPGALVARPGGDLTLIRGADPQAVGRVRLTYLEAEGDYETRAAEVVFPDEGRTDVAQSELPLLLTRGEARATVGRWLAETRIARDLVRFHLPPSAPWGVGDVVAIPAEGGERLYRIDRCERTEVHEVEAVRIEPGAYRAGDPADDPVPARGWSAPVPATPLFLDLPLIRGDENPQAPHLTAVAQPWPGVLALFDAPAEGGDFALNATLPLPGAVGQTLTALARTMPGRWSRDAGVVVAFPAGVEPAGASPRAVLDGANLLALGNGVDWEVVQFTDAELIGPGQWLLSGLLRGQFGTDALVPAVWPVETLAVPLDERLRQIALPSAARLIPRRYRLGPASRPIDDPVYVERVEAFAGVGLRPYAPVHLRARRVAGGTLAIRWTRRTRLGGDDWEGFEVPLAEDRELYLLRIHEGTALRREEVLETPDWTYTPAQQAADGIAGPFSISVAQVSALFGAGPAAQVVVPG